LHPLLPYDRAVLYRPDAFEPLTDEPWDENLIRAAIARIVADAEEAFDPDGLWPAVESDAGGGGARLPLTTLYAGAAGVVYGLDALHRRGHADARLDLEAAARRALDAWRASPDFETRDEAPVRTDASLFFAETGILLVAWRLAPRDDVADALHARVRENAYNETNELMAGSPGTMLAARAMLDWTGQDRWAAAWRESADELWRRRDADGLWTYPPYGRGLGASHGVGTNTNVLLQGGDLLSAERRAELKRGTAEILARTAVLEDGLANWPLAVDEPELVGWDGQIRVQWCHGAPGVVASAASYLDEELLLAGAELAWRAGPPNMEKGPGLCHGTAGNGYAFLKVFERTGDERWLERARRFASHALGQVERWRTARGRGRYSLWTGDVGAALYAAACLDGHALMPVLDSRE
jgi:Lanthionine synthetase C-like protein